MSKYEPLWKYIKENNKDEYKLSFERVKKITGFEFDHAFLTFKKGGEFVGKFRDGRRYGFGIRKYPNGDEYIGAWDTFKDGYGIFTYENGDVYEGMFKNDKRNG